MKIWPFVPLDGMVEALEWRTDVIRAKSAEQRLALRNAPRQSFEFTHVFHPRQYAIARALAYGIGIQDLFAPVWTEHTALGIVAQGATYLTFDTSYADYRSGGWALLWDTDELFEAVAIAAVSSGGITLSAPVSENYQDAYVMPLRIARTSQGLTLTRTDPELVQAKIAFEAIDGIDLGVDPGYPDYRGHDVMTDASVIAGGLEERVLRESEIIDNDVGVPALDPLYTYQTERFTLSWQVITRQELWDLRRWLHSRRGKQKGFWLPTWNHDFELLQDIGASDTTLTVRAIGYPDHYGVRDIMIRTLTGQHYYTRILSGAAGASGEEILQLESALGVSLARASIDRISLLHFVRFAADRVEILHRADLGASVVVPCEEVPLP